MAAKRFSEESSTKRARYRQKGGNITRSKKHNSSRRLEGEKGIKLRKHVGYYENILMYKLTHGVVGNPNGGVEQAEGKVRKLHCLVTD